MEPATQRFFSIPELISLLSTHLDHKGISRLMRTSRHMYERWTSAHYHNVRASFRPGRNNILGSTGSILALSRNVHHVRELELGLYDLVYYFNGIIAFQDLLLQTQGTRFSRPRWLAPPDPYICPVLPMPPMTLLTKLTVNIDRRPEDKRNNSCPYYLPSHWDPRATSTQVCWFLQLNPHLTHVALSGLVFKDDKDVRMLASSIYELKNLQDLSLSGFYWVGSTLTVGQDILYNCPLSLRTLTMGLFEWESNTWRGICKDDYYLTEAFQLQSGEKVDEECDLTETRWRHTPLIHLTRLALWELDSKLNEEEFVAMLRRCPNICVLELPSLDDSVKPERLASEIAKICPKLVSLTHRDKDFDDAHSELALRILDALPPQQIQEFRCYSESLEIFELDSRLLFRRHSTTLREVVLSGCQSVKDKAVQVLLVECKALEVLDIDWAYDRNELSIDLKDAIKFPWGCKKLRWLRLTIGVPDEPLYRHTGVEPYYNRPPPTTLSIAEREQFEQLEAYYRQIGALTELESLHLRVFFYDPQGVRPLSDSTGINTFPGLLSTGNRRSGRPGYLHHLAGLTKLKELFGSVLAVTEETQMTMGLKEASWIDDHWPALERAHFYPKDYTDLVKDEFKWLMDQRKHGGKPLDLSAFE